MVPYFRSSLILILGRSMKNIGIFFSFLVLLSAMEDSFKEYIYKAVASGEWVTGSESLEMLR